MCIPLSLLGNGSVKLLLSFLGNGLVKIPLYLPGNCSVKIYLIVAVARQRLGTEVTAVTNTHATTEELLGASFSMWPVSYKGK
jgi:hypothetical protein